MKTHAASFAGGGRKVPVAARAGRRSRAFSFAGLSALCLLPQARSASLWDVRALERPPAVEYAAKEGLVQEIYYSGEPSGGKPTRVFGYLGRPKAETPGEKFPALVLVHGGGGQAFREWAE